MPTISVQNLCDSSISRTLRTRWLTPTGVTARSGAADVLSAIMGLAIWLAPIVPLRGGRRKQRSGPSPKRRADHQPDEEENQEADDAEEEQYLRDTRGGGRNTGEPEQRGDQRHDEKEQGQFEHRHLRRNVNRLNIARNAVQEASPTIRPARGAGAGSGDLVHRVFVGEAAQLALLGDRNEPLASEQAGGKRVFDHGTGREDRL